MSKPSTKRAATRRTKSRRKAAPKPVTPAPQAPEAAEQVDEAEVVPSDSAWQPSEAEAAEQSEPVAEEPPVEELAAAQVEAPETDARSQMVMLGPVECRIRRVPLETVLGLLSPDGLRRIEAHEGTASFESTCQRLRATDGRATPVVIEGAEEGPPTILHGFEEIAAARVCGVPTIFVILVPPGGASEAQSHIVEMVRQQRAKGKTSDDDELFYRVHAEG